VELVDGQQVSFISGALFHHFPNKEAILQALYVDAMRSVQRGYWDALGEEPATVRECVEGVVHHLLSWVEGNPRWARFLYAHGHLDRSCSCPISALASGSAAGIPCHQRSPIHPPR
jgi:AcrR family transcriptional regulator